jgi:predicted Zn-dependent protease
MNLGHNLILTASAFIVSATLLSGCAKNGEVVRVAADDTYSGSSAYSEMLGRQAPTVAIDEYINRTGKKLLLVSSNPEADYVFKVTNRGTKTPINVEPHGVIAIDRTAINSLNNEAELAYLLGSAINKINRQFASVSTIEEDSELISLLVRAGYDPSVSLDMLKPCLNLDCQASGAPVAFVLENKTIDSKRIDYNRQAVTVAPKGLQKYTDRFINIVKG